MVLLIRLGVRLNRESEGSEIIDREFDESESFVALDDFRRGSTWPYQDNGHRFAVTVVVERSAVRTFLTRLRREVPRRDAPPNMRG